MMQMNVMRESIVDCMLDTVEWCRTVGPAKQR